MKTLKEINARLTEVDVEVRAAEAMETLDALEKEKTELLERKVELEEIEERKRTALEINDNKKPDILTIDKRIHIAKTLEPEKLTRQELRSSDEYRNGFFKNLMGLPMTDIERRYVSSTDFAGALPTETQNEIVKKMRVLAPMLNEITLLRVNGNVNVAVEGTNNAADKHTENATITAANDTLSYISLGGFEITKLLTMSKITNIFSVAGLEDYITDILSENIASKIESYILYGTGDSQPKGVNLANSWSDGTNGVDWGAANPTYDEMIELISYLGGGYARRAKFCMKHSTYWQHIAKLKDDSKYPIAMNSNAGEYRILGYPVIFSDSMTDGEIFFGDFKKIVGNLAEDINVTSGFVIAKNAYDILGCAIFDCDVADPAGFVKSEATLA